MTASCSVSSGLSGVMKRAVDVRANGEHSGWDMPLSDDSDFCDSHSLKRRRLPGGTNAAASASENVRTGGPEQPVLGACLELQNEQDLGKALAETKSEQEGTQTHVENPAMVDYVIDVDADDVVELVSQKARPESTSKGSSTSKSLAAWPFRSAAGKKQTETCRAGKFTEHEAPRGACAYLALSSTEKPAEGLSAKDEGVSVGLDGSVGGQRGGSYKPAEMRKKASSMRWPVKWKEPEAKRGRGIKSEHATGEQSALASEHAICDVGPEGTDSTKRKYQHAPNKRVPGTTFTVDSFRADPGHCRNFFLSHFHSDHYGGLSRKFPWKIFCSSITARLVQLEFNLSDSQFVVLPLMKPVEIHDEGVSLATREAIKREQGHDAAKGIILRGATCIALDANHCPGSVMFLFLVWTTGKRILHCGDCRFERSIFELQEPLRLLSTNATDDTRLDVLYLDTTYSNKQYTFPPQRQVIDAVLRAARCEQFSGRDVAYFVGSYTIGKERVYLELAEALDARLVVSKRKQAVLKCLDLPLSDWERISNVVDTSASTRPHIFIVPMGQLNMNHFREFLARNASRFKYAVGFRPTGWTWRTKDSVKGGQLTLHRMQSKNCVLYEAPYSEHSSFDELVEFCRWLRPLRIIPTVGREGSAGQLFERLQQP
ncbi:DNA cross-link repair 1A protein [Porphyridium purpureum]|uniref:DNA cross-link repair 1A protein n=1 Tax=Porphyridium purpureum TaxID=35688 RepID=A0A5J4YUW3_PORPP|nr:DNA cross-link repair 1A protein [Porphyridium purpureum]|eukprot:POR2402..scf227_4